MQESVRISQWVYTVLHADAQLLALVGGRIYSGVAPQEAVFPYITYTPLSEKDQTTMQAVRVWTEMVFLVEAIDETESYQSLLPMADRIDAVLHPSNIGGAPTNPTAVPGIIVLASFRTGPSQRRESSQEGTTYSHLGGRFRVRAAST